MGWSEGYFVTKNTSDFSDPKAGFNILHPELLIQNIKVHYHNSLGEFLHKQKQGSSNLKKSKQISDISTESIIELIDNKDGNILTYLHNVFSKIYTQIEFVPTEILYRIHPFTIVNNKNNYSHYSNFTLLTNNNELYNFFFNLTSIPTKVNLKGKLKYVISSLNSNLVFSIGRITGSEEINIRIKQTPCKCIRCAYKKLDLNKIFLNIEKERDSKKRAFIYFQIGKYVEAFWEYYEEFEKAKKDNKRSLAYILFHNLLWLSNILEYNDDEKLKIAIAKIKKLQPEHEYLLTISGSKFDKEFANFFQRGHVLSYYRLKIKNILIAIQDHHKVQIRGGSSINSNYLNLVSQFSEFESFIFSNNIVATAFTDFQLISNDFVEAVFLLHSLNKYQGAQISFFNNYLLKLILLYGKADHIIKLYTEYIRKQIPVKDTSEFEVVALNFLSTGKEVFNFYQNEKNWESAASFFRIFWNLLLLLSIVDFKKNFILKCSKKILVFLQKMPVTESYQLNHLASFIHSKGKVLGKKYLKTLLDFFLSGPVFFSSPAMKALSSVDGRNPYTLVTSREIFNQIQELIFKKEGQLDPSYYDQTFSFYTILNKTFKTELSKRISLELESDFKMDVYYEAAIFEIIDFREHFPKYLESFQKVEMYGQEKRRTLNRSEITVREINELINLVFKFNVQLPLELIKRIKNVSSYYEWLVDLNHFDYAQFNPLWITQYPSSIYFENVFSDLEVRKRVREFLKENYNPRLAFYYSQYVN